MSRLSNLTKARVALASIHEFIFDILTDKTSAEYINMNKAIEDIYDFMEPKTRG